MGLIPKASAKRPYRCHSPPQKKKVPAWQISSLGAGVIEILGWLGVGLIILAYALVSSGKIKPMTVTYQNLNLWGAVCMVIYLYCHQAWASVFHNIIWGGIALYGLYRIWRKHA
jgi:hypothetical protein